MKTISILGSTGSIGKTTIGILKKDKKNFNIKLLTTNKNIKILKKQALEFNVKHLVVTNKKKYLILKKELRNKKKIKIYNDINYIDKIFKKKIDYTMSSISGLAGLKPTLDAITFSKTIAIANKESLICAWNLIQKKLIKENTIFIPVDSEHFSIWSLLEDNKNLQIEQVILTASGGPFLNISNKKLKMISPRKAIKHPNWSMGKKISIDSATMMNKVFEVIEAKKIFDIEFKKFKILIHPKSYIHAIVKFNNGLTKILIHDTDMKIPIFNSINFDNNLSIKSKKLNLKILNNLNLTEVNLKRFPVVKFLKKLPKGNSLFETIIVSANDTLVQLFLEKKIKFLDISRILKKIIYLKEFKKYKRIKPLNFNKILELNRYVRLKTKSLSVLSQPYE